MIQENVQLKCHSTYGIGGLAKYFAVIDTRDSLSKALEFARDNHTSFIAIGKGSNALFDDAGYDGLVILNKLCEYSLDGDEVTVGAGFSFTLLGKRTSRDKLGGLEFASGIPGTVGGAVFMNAGAGERETKDALISVEYMKSDGEIVTLKRNEIEFGYRYSQFHKMDGVIVSATFKLQPDKLAKERQSDLLKHRMETQPYADKSCGCAFRNPDQASAGKLIEESGLKGVRRGGAEVSSVHANFIVNREGATSKDIRDLIGHIQGVVAEKTGHNLACEVRYIPFKEKNGKKI